MRYCSTALVSVYTRLIVKRMASSFVQPLVCEVCDEKKVAAYRCLDCKQDICTDCSKIHQRIAATSNHSVADVQQSDPIKQQRRSKCRNHDDQVMRFYCTTCDKLICQKCTETDHREPEHEYTDCTKASASFKQSLSKFFTPLEETVKDLNQSVAIACKIKEKLDSAVERTIADVKRKTDEIKAEISTHEGRIIDQIKDVQKDRNIELDERKQAVTTVSKKIQHSLRSARDACCTLTDEAFLNLYPSISKELEALTNQDLPKIDTKLSCMRFDGGQSNINLGHVELKGRWKLALRFGEHGSGPGEFSSVRSVFSVPSGEILLADYNNQRVVICNMEGYQIRSVPMQNNPRDLQAINDRIAVVDSSGLVKIFNNDSTQAFEFPTVPSSETGTAVDLWSITVKKDGTLVIGDTTRFVLTEHSPVDGTLLRTIPVRLEPQYIALLGDNQFLVSGWKREVDIIDSNGATLITIEPKIEGYGVSHCTGICSDESGIYIGVDNGSENGHIHHYGHDGEFLVCIAHGLYRPQGIALLADGEHLAVSDWFSVKIYNIM